MSKYDGEKCVICDKIFLKDDDIVVCPVCAAPQHRDCYSNSKICGFIDNHKTNTIWQPSNLEINNHDKINVENICNKCQKSNSPNNVFCENCNSPMNNFNLSKSDININPFLRSYLNTDNFIDIYSKLKSDDLIDGVSVEDLSIFLGKNSNYFLHKFKYYSDNNMPKRSFWNFSFLIFDFYYFLYRKMYLFAFIYILVFLLLTIPAIFIYNVNVVSNKLLFIYFFTQIASILFKVYISMYFNKFYMKRCIKKIKRLKVKFKDKDTYKKMLVKYGGTSINSIIIFSITFLFVYFIAYNLYKFLI